MADIELINLGSRPSPLLKSGFDGRTVAKGACGVAREAKSPAHQRVQEPEVPFAKAQEGEKQVDQDEGQEVLEKSVAAFRVEKGPFFL